MQARIFDIRLKSIALQKVPELDKNDQLLIRYRLVCPRPGSYSVERSHSAKWKRGRGVDIDGETLRYETDGLPLDKRIVFREHIEGESMLQIEVLALDKPAKLGRFMVSLLKGAIEGMFEYFTGAEGLISNKLSQKVLAKVKDDWFIGNINSDEKGATIQLGTATLAIREDGSFDLSVDSIEDGVNGMQTLKLDLDTTEECKITAIDVVGSVTPTGSSSRTHNTHGQMEKKVVFSLAKGAPNGNIKLLVSNYVR